MAVAKVRKNSSSPYCSSCVCVCVCVCERERERARECAHARVRIHIGVGLWKEGWQAHKHKVAYLN